MKGVWYIYIIRYVQYVLLLLSISKTLCVCTLCELVVCYAFAVVIMSDVAKSFSSNDQALFYKTLQAFV